MKKTTSSVLSAVVLTAALAPLAALCDFTQAKADPTPNAGMPPTYLSGVATYAANGRFVKLLMGSTRFLTCRMALDDTETALAKAQEMQPAGARSEGICIPLHTYNYADVSGLNGPQTDESLF